MKYLIDSSAWVEYLEGSQVGEKVNQILKEDNEIITLPINIAEVISYISRKKGDVKLAYDLIIKNSQQFNFTIRIAKEAGILHAKMKTENSSFSLADGFMIISAKRLSANLITKDHHFKQFKEAIII